MHIIPKEVTWETPVPKRLCGFTLMELLVVIAIMTIIGGILVGGLKGCSPGGYSTGSRAGIVTKFSNKGLFNKSWEGELSIGGTTTDSEGHLVANNWAFSVVDLEVVTKIQDALDHGTRVRLTYKQGGLVLGTRDTSYIVTDVTPIK